LRERFRDAQLPVAQRHALTIVRPYTMLARVRLLSLWDQVQTCEREHIDGALVECGVWKGGAVGLMALASQGMGGPPRQIHVFDVFDDICEPDPAIDGERALREAREWGGLTDPSGRLQPIKGFYDHNGGPGTLDVCRDLLEKRIGHPPDHCHYHVGWFQDTVPSAVVGPIAVLRLDGDWYASTRVCLDHLYESVVPGGFVVVDDYGAYEGCARAVDEFRAERSIGSEMIWIDSDAVWWRR
jgi:O-methyltransferase